MPQPPNQPLSNHDKLAQFGRLVGQVLALDSSAHFALRSAFRSPTLRNRGLIHLARLSFDGRQVLGLLVPEFIACAVAFNPKHDPAAGSFALALRKLTGPVDVPAPDRHPTFEVRFQHPTFEVRFQQLLDADRETAVKLLLPPWFQLLKQKDVFVDYVQLGVDLTYWSTWTKDEWARRFWGAPDEPVVETVSEVLK